jgi:hypothetical protein
VTRKRRRRRRKRKGGGAEVSAIDEVSLATIVKVPAET